MQEVDGVLVVARELKRPLLELRQLALGFDGNGAADEAVRAEMVGVAERAMRQVDDLVKMRNLAEYELEPVAVRAVCDDVLKEVAEMFENGAAKKCRMRVKYCNRQRLAMANPELLKSVVYNFLLDATHYATIETRAELKVHEEKGKVAIEVRDFGPALPTRMWREMQQNLVRQPSDIAMRPGSSALGLYIASKFSKYMNAEVSAVRHRDGTSFAVKLPSVKQMSILET